MEQEKNSLLEFIDPETGEIIKKYSGPVFAICLFLITIGLWYLIILFISCFIFGFIVG